MNREQHLENTLKAFRELVNAQTKTMQELIEYNAELCVERDELLSLAQELREALRMREDYQDVWAESNITRIDETLNKYK